MTFQNSLRVFICFLFVLAKVTPWTIDLPEVRKNIFSDHDKLKKSSENEYKMYTNNGHEFYSNIKGNSKHNSDVGKINQEHNDQYANTFRHQSYMQKKVSEIVQNGGNYLEGLRRALEAYSWFLVECGKENKNLAQSSNATWMPPVWPSRLTVSTSLNLTNPQTFNTSAGPMTTGNEDFAGMTRPVANKSCKETLQASESVRRYADLATWATRRLQDLSHARQYKKTNQYEENELILKLATFLDQLALLTGYEPDSTKYLSHETSTTSTTSPTPPTYVPQTRELVYILSNCLEVNSSIPAIDRCRYPLHLPAMGSQAMGATSTPIPGSDVKDAVLVGNLDSQPQVSMDHRTPRKITKRSPEEYLLPIAVQEKPKSLVNYIVKRLSNLKAIVKSVKNHAVADIASQLAYHKYLHKRSIDDNTFILLNQATKADESNDQYNERTAKVHYSLRKHAQSIVEPEKSVAKSANPIDEFDEPNTNNDKSTIEALSLEQLPNLDASVINTKSFKKPSIFNSGRYFNLLNRMTFQKAPVKVPVKNDQLAKLTSYYFKHKVLVNTNPALVQSKKSLKNYELNNNLPAKVITKRDLVNN